MNKTMLTHEHKVLSLLLLVALALTGCQALAVSKVTVFDTPVPTLTPVLLPPTTVAPPTQAPAASGAFAATATRPPATVAVQTAPTPEPAKSPTALPARFLALGVHPTVTLRTTPGANAAAVISLPGSRSLWAEGRTEDGKWLWVVYGEDSSEPQPSGRAWAAQADLVLLGDAQDLPVVSFQAVQNPQPTPEIPAAAAPANALAGGTSSLEGRVLGTRLNVREGPGVDQPVLGQLNAGDNVSVVGRSQNSEWLALSWPASIVLPAGKAEVAPTPPAVVWVAAQYVEVSGTSSSGSGKVSDLPVLATATSPVPTPAPPFTGKIAFQTATGGDIYVVNVEDPRQGADGGTSSLEDSGLRRVATGLDPTFSPDGTRLAYARWDAPHGLYVLDLRTEQEQRVTTAARPRSPSWSPDGQRLAFTYVTREYVCLDTPFGCIDEATVRQIFGGQDCIDTPMGRFCIADFRPRLAENFGLVQVTVADGAWLDLAAQEKIQSPVWHPDRDEILYRGNRGLQITVPGGATRALVENVDLTSPAWSPDGQRIVAQIYLHDHTDIFLLDAAGNVQKRLTAPPSSTASEIPARGRAPNNVAPAWSPDGRYILFLSDRDGSWRLYRMNADGSGQAPFLPDALGKLTFSYNFAAERVVNWGR
jgi:hypothetical protein